MLSRSSSVVSRDVHGVLDAKLGFARLTLGIKHGVGRNRAVGRFKIAHQSTWTTTEPAFRHRTVQGRLWQPRPSQVSCVRWYSNPAATIWPLHYYGPPKVLRTGKPCQRNCIVTGGTSGIGYEIAKTLVLEGASSVRMISRDISRAERAIENIKRETGHDDAPLGIIEGDLSSPATVLAEWTKYSKSSDNSPIDTLINCAGLSQNQLLQRTSSEEISKLLSVNLQAPIELSKAFLNGYQTYALQRQKKQREKPPTNVSFCVVNVSSLLGDFATPGTSVYSATKAGLTAFTRSLSVEGAQIWKRYNELVPPFRANVVVPGYTDTPMISDFTESHKSSLIDEIPLARFGTAQEVAEAVMFLLRNEYANNCVLNLDGGLSAA